MCKDYLTIGVLQYQYQQLQDEDTKEARELSKAIYNFLRANYPEAWWDNNEPTTD